jgi:alkylation response protein AidB-like acyl-CoA dehydrogenase
VTSSRRLGVGDRFELGAEAEPFRAEVRTFLAEHAPGGPPGRQFPRDFAARLAAAGLVAPHWPRPWGLDAGPLQQLAVDAELRAAGAPRPFNPIGIGWAGPTLLVAGTPEQQARWIPGILDGSEIWCQLFSEPGAGSDLASLATRATRDGDEWVVNGQKVWTTFAHLARWGILLARTDPAADAHHGISYFVVDMRSPGITIRPIRQMDGKADFNEVFLADVRVPMSGLVGTEHDGWRLAKVTLGNERVSLSGEGALWGQGPTADDVLDLVRASGGTSDARLRQRLAGLYVEAEVLRLIRLRTLSARVRGLEPGPEASVRKALADEHGQHVMALALDLAGTHALLADRGPYASETRLWADGYLYSRALTIGGGTSEVQRNIVAERVLGLPREPEAP